ncbi:hypothetical protein [Desulforhopalus singaporensis]|uniref:Uncharacterized protein n=1 Tax=Desulforhopalus singaporensis TaxID=91360 RepID=A0A1H0N492_9BACT|nr:hypothetical protein [Desulforhopalus singaporensis]SDO87336.1 hypothetical protein SAMN05660330_01234 [Desulforhopalus singaporensis]
MANGTKLERKAAAGVSEKGNVATEVSKVSITFVAILGVAVGLWSLACIVGGLAASGGPLQFVANWFRAVTGM